jgi:hypothetical protein
MNKAEEKDEKQKEDSDIIFTAISSGDFDNFEQAQRAVVMGYVTDMSFSRAGISHALVRLERFYKERNKDQS